MKISMFKKLGQVLYCAFPLLKKRQKITAVSKSYDFACHLKKVNSQGTQFLPYKQDFLSDREFHGKQLQCLSRYHSDKAVRISFTEIFQRLREEAISVLKTFNFFSRIWQF